MSLTLLAMTEKERYEGSEGECSTHFIRSNIDKVGEAYLRLRDAGRPRLPTSCSMIVVLRP